MINPVFESYLTQYGSYPSPTESEDMNLGNFPIFDKPKGKLKQNPQRLFIDVTHTVHYPFNSGIQRVVRTLVSEMKKNGASFELIKFNLDSQPIQLTTHEIDKFYNWEKYVSSNPNTVERIDSIARAFGPFIKTIIPNSLWNSAKRNYFKLKAQLRSGKSLAQSAALPEIIDLRNKKLLLPEVVTESERIHAVTLLSKHYQTKVTTILYDLIPVTHPEYCTIGYDFIHYLKIFRTIDTVLSISKHSESELNKLMAFAPREVSQPLKTKTIYLGGDFSFLKDAQPTSVVDSKKIILMVARFEPRKNIRRVLVAIKKLFEESHNFKFVLVGNPGWLQENILSDLEELKAKNFDIEYHMRVSDAELVAWYQKCYFTIFCSITEGFGLPILESVLMGKPCITANSGSQAEVGNLTGGCDFADPFDINDIYQKVKRLLTDTHHYKSQSDKTKSAKWPTWSDYAKDVYANLTDKDE